ncbi:MAG TPA: hypothetical protein VK211_24060 [Kamptonema sp.]|nr:hypothetical protein [Kamptonema sp.]
MLSPSTLLTVTSYGYCCSRSHASAFSAVIATAKAVRTILIAETLAIITSSFFLLPSSFFLLL